jgi:dTDP-4-dehydrorhamnose reductase
MIVLFGANGMLGNYVKNVLSPSYDVVSFTRSEFDIESADWNALSTLLIKIKKGDIVINCAGAIPQRNTDAKKYILLNTLFPHKLNEIVKTKEVRLIHITTNCVFSGKKGNYIETDTDYGDSLYDITKLLGEPYEACIIRTSIIGEEKDNKKSLLEWVIQQKGKEINGFTNVFWNGVTCLQLANILKQMIEEDIYWEGVRHIFSPNTVSKYELCQCINEIYNLGIKITAIDHPKSDLTLSSTYCLPFHIPSIEEQIKETFQYNL